MPTHTNACMIDHGDSKLPGVCREAEPPLDEQPAGSSSHFSFPALSRPDSPDPFAPLHAQLEANAAAEPSRLAKTLSGPSAQLLAAALAAAGDDEALADVLTAHAKSPQPLLTQSLRQRLQQDAELRAGAYLVCKCFRLTELTIASSGMHAVGSCISVTEAVNLSCPRAVGCNAHLMLPASGLAERVPCRRGWGCANQGCVPTRCQADQVSAARPCGYGGAGNPQA